MTLTSPLLRPVVLVGPPASGKSALAAALAERLGRTFADVDDIVTREADRTIAAIFAAEGEAGFRVRERRAVEAALTDGTGVIATGGGSLLDPTLRRRVLREAHVLSLDAPLSVLVERARRTEGARPLLDGDLAARLVDLLEARRDAYTEAHASIDGDAALDVVVERALAAIDDLERSPTLVMPLGHRTYRVHVEAIANLGERARALAPSAIVLVTDAKVERALHERFPGLDDARRVVLSGRADRDKTLASVTRVWDAALEVGIDRAALVVGVGGGGVTDLAGFAAATLLRGVRYASAPTTLLAMVDASVGGKTGFDHALGKNLIGAFHQPSVVVCDPTCLSSLPARDVRAGLAEIVKIALVRDADLLGHIDADRGRLSRCDLDAVSALVPGAVQAKIDVVVQDEREAGERELLNFGHTVGHALEAAAGRRLPHGECVAIGMRAALDLGERLGVTPKEVAASAHALLDAVGLPASAPPSLDEGLAARALESDKKRRGGELRFVLLEGPGRASVQPVPRSEALWSLERVLARPVDSVRNPRSG